MEVLNYLKLFVVVLLFVSSNSFADGRIGSTSKASATITLTIPAYVFQNSVKSFDFNYDEPYQMTSFSGGEYKVIKQCPGRSKCDPVNTAKVIIFEPI